MVKIKFLQFLLCKNPNVFIYTKVSLFYIFLELSLILITINMFIYIKFHINFHLIN